MNKLKFIAFALGVGLFFGIGPIAGAQTGTTNADLVNQITSLLQQVKSLQEQIASLNAQKAALQTELKSVVQLTKQLALGMTSEEVKTLQEMLAADPSIYPEGLVTGYFGVLTQKAVMRFQKKHGLEQVGVVGPKTRAKLNELISQGTISGSLPPGLAKKIGVMSSTTASTTALGLGWGTIKVTLCHKGQTLTVGSPALSAHLGHGDTVGACGSVVPAPTTTDTVAPVISNLVATGTSSTTGYISWTTDENATSTLWYASSTPLNTSTALMLSNDTWKTLHSYNLTGLTASTTYYYKVKVSDAAGNATTSEEKSFTTE